MKIKFELTFKQFYDMRQAINAIYFKAKIDCDIQFINVKEFLFVSGQGIINMTYKQNLPHKKMKFKMDLNHYQALHTLLFDNKSKVDSYLFSLFMTVQIEAERQIQTTIAHFKANEIR